MANPFKEAEKAKKKPAGNPKPPVGNEETVAVPNSEGTTIPAVAVPEVKETPAEKKKEEPSAKETPKAKVEKPAAKKSSLLAGLDPETEKEEFATRAYYLSMKNIEKLNKVAEEKGKSASKVLDYILSEVL